MARLDVQKLRKQYSEIPINTHHKNVLSHGKQ
jgi:hypothetical protein